MSILVRPTTSAKRSSGKKRPGTFDSAKLLIDLANMRDDDNGVWNFRKRWDHYAGYSKERLIHRRDELQLLWRHLAPPFGAVYPWMTKYQERLFDGWLERPSGDSLEQTICQDWLDLDKGGLHVDWTPKVKGIRPDAGSLSKVLAWACLMHAEHLAVCRNAECSAPYFIASKTDQRFCSQDCAWPAKKEAKLKWWRENRGKKVSAPKSVKSENTKGKR
jgi:hypothetical protein